MAVENRKNAAPALRGYHESVGDRKSIYYREEDRFEWHPKYYLARIGK